MSLLKKSAFLLLAASIFSCSEDEEVLNSKSASSNSNYSKADKQTLMTGFAKSLSSIVEESQEARKLLKDEAVQQFDKNYDVLWENVKGKYVGNITFREYLEKKSSSEFMDALETEVPNLNILFPENPFFNLSAESYDPADAELPVVVSTDKINLLYFEGEFKDSVAKGQIPGFNLLVVNENSRVIVDKTPVTRGSSRGWQFKSEAFDGSIPDSETRTSVAYTLAGTKALLAYQVFNKDDGSIYSKALQRDFIYYGMTPDKQEGQLNRSVSEYISFIKVNPNAYFRMADQSGDAILTTTTTDHEKGPLSEEQLIDRFWNKGVYDLRFEIYKTTSSIPTIVYVSAKPTDLWNLNMEQTNYRHSTWFRHSKYWYAIDPWKFTAKTFNLGTKVNMGKWNIAEEGLERRIVIYEDDITEQVTSSFEYETTKVKSSKFKGDVKLELGLGKAKVNGGVEYENNSSNTDREKRTITVSRSLASDHLGTFDIYFYDPIVNKWNNSGISILSCDMHTYNSGFVELGVTAY